MLANEQFSNEEHSIKLYHNSTAHNDKKAVHKFGLE